jgi:ubiquinone/menaquinone biosynthesis C-methylase UbiE
VGLWDRIWAAGYDFLGTRFARIEEPHRRRLVEEVTGEVVEIGSGTGFNFPYYRRAVRVVALEPDEGMRRRSIRRAREAAVPIEVREGNAHDLELPDASFDVAIFALVLCTIPDPARAVAEATRVLRPGGEIRFYEHIRAEDPAIARRQDRFTRPWKAFNRGCHPNRDTVGLIERSGLRMSELERFDLKGAPKIVRPHALGSAVKD